MSTSEKEKGLAGVEPLIYAFNFKRLTQFINDISQRRTNRSEWGRCKALAFKTIGRGFAPRQRFFYFRDRLLSGVLHQPILQAYEGVFEPGTSRY